ncbi:hypothetical protein KDL01_38510 [Actinospica durhamensis]|uniref:Uncharacterized protein n=1 Tax=Actinospica durhamensis TaxID=1508375 RepID=A0A941IT27_9ACTN|nr:hypothetical protein [Actinospica durhamensis]MBR7839219.1 hypothetical protein [Actinospica durhamensis]
MPGHARLHGLLPARPYADRELWCTGCWNRLSEFERFHLIFRLRPFVRSRAPSDTSTISYTYNGYLSTLAEIKTYGSTGAGAGPPATADGPA